MNPVLEAYVKCASCGGTHKISREFNLGIARRAHVFICPRAVCKRTADARGLEYLLIEDIQLAAKKACLPTAS